MPGIILPQIPLEDMKIIYDSFCWLGDKGRICKIVASNGICRLIENPFCMQT
jgi:hypothetical protein